MSGRGRGPRTSVRITLYFIVLILLALFIINVLEVRVTGVSLYRLSHSIGEALCITIRTRAIESTKHCELHIDHKKIRTIILWLRHAIKLIDLYCMTKSEFLIFDRTTETSDHNVREPDRPANAPNPMSTSRGTESMLIPVYIWIFFLH